MDLKNTAVRVGKAAGTKAVPADSGAGEGGGCQRPTGVKACPENTKSQEPGDTGTLRPAPLPQDPKCPDYRAFFKNFL